MNGERRYFLDTNALVALGNGDSHLGLIVENADYLGTSVICKLEYLSWPALSESVRERFLIFLQQIELVGLDATDVALHEQIVSLRTNRPGIKLPDAIVMASAKSRNSVLLTQDRQVLNSGLCEASDF